MKRYTSADVDRIASLQEPQPTTRVMWWVPVVLLIAFLFLFGWGARAAETPDQQTARYRLRDAWRLSREFGADKAAAAEAQAAREAYAALTGQSAAPGKMLAFPRQTPAEQEEERVYEEGYQARLRLRLAGR